MTVLRETKPKRRSNARQLAWPSTLPDHWHGNVMMATLDRRMGSALATRTETPPSPPPSSSLRFRPATGSRWMAAKRNRRAV